MAIHYEQLDGHVARITIDRPEARNSLDLYHFRDLAEAWRRFHDDPDDWVAIITGVDGNFMTGADLKTYIPQVTALQQQIQAGDVAEIDGCRLRDGTDAVLRSLKVYKPIIAAVDGPCVAGGMEMLGGIDIRVATERATFGVMEPKRGLFAGGGTTVRLPRQLSYPAAMEFLLTAEAFPASRAMELGLLNEIVPQDELADRALAWAARITVNAPLAVQATKESVLRGLAVDQREAYKIENELAGKIFSSDDAKEGPKAFAEKREAALDRHMSSGSVDPRTPCVIGVAQRTVRPGEGPCPEPLVLWEEVTRAAAEDALPGGGARVLAGTDSLQVVYCMAWPYDAPVDRLADSLGIDPGHRLYSGIGGTTPQVLVQDAAEAILAGHADLAVITGAEALETKRQAKKAGERPAWSHRAEVPAPFPFEAPFHPAEVAHEVFQAWLTFPTFDVARRARLGIDPAAYQRAIGELLAPMSEVAATNPHAWFPRALSAEHLSTPTPTNRIVGYPYTKQAVSIMDVDMAATVIVASHAKADELGVPPERRAYLHGWCYATDPIYLAEHPDLSASPAMAAASAEALRAAGASIDDVAHLDLYSCFASSVHLACDALGIAPDDPRGLTVTGGLPFSGGAGSNYVLHSIAAMVEVLRGDPGALGLVSGVGMHMTKHVYGLYSTAPPAHGRATPPDAAAVQARLDAIPTPAIVDRHTGPATVASYTVAHGRDGAPGWGLVLGDVAGGRAYGRVEDPDLLADLEATEWVGRQVDLISQDSGVNLVRA